MKGFAILTGWVQKVMPSWPIGHREHVSPALTNQV